MSGLSLDETDRRTRGARNRNDAVSYIFTLIIALALAVLLLPSNAAADDDPVWTVMVYMAADNDLEEFAIMDMNELEMVGSTANMNVVVQFDRIDGYDDSNDNWTGTRRYSITKDADDKNITSTMEWDLGEANMGDPAVLTAFIEWSMANYTADRYLLVLWDHGSGNAVCFDETNDDDALTTVEVGDALSYAYDNTSAMIDIVAFDACLMGTTEMAYEITPFADYMVASEDLVPGMGLPYDNVTSFLSDNPAMSPESIAADIAWTYYDDYRGMDYPSSLTSAAINLSYMGDVVDAVEDLVDVMKGNLSGYQNLTDAWFNAQFFNTGEVRHLLDLYNYTENLHAMVEHPALRNAADAVMDAVDDAVIASYAYTDEDDFPVDQANGLSIFAPMGEYMWDDGYYMTRFDDDTGWSDMLWDYFINDTDEWFFDVRFELWDQSGDGWDDAINITYDVDTGATDADISVGFWVFNIEDGFGQDNVYSDMATETVYGSDFDEFNFSFIAGEAGWYQFVLAVMDGHEPGGDGAPMQIEDFWEIMYLYLDGSGYYYNGTADIYVNNSYEGQWGDLYIDGDWWGNYWVDGYGEYPIETANLSEGWHEVYFNLDNGAEDWLNFEIEVNDTTDVTLYPWKDSGKDDGWLDLWVYNRFNESVNASLYMDGEWWDMAEIDAESWFYFGNYTMWPDWHTVEVQFDNGAYNYTEFGIREGETTGVDAYPDIYYGWVEIWVYNGFADQQVDLAIDSGWFDNEWINEDDTYYFGNFTRMAGFHLFEAIGNDDGYDWMYVSIRENETTDVYLMLVPEKMVLLRGYVWDQWDAALSGVRITGENVDANFREENWTDGNGYYELWVPAGWLDLSAWKRDHLDHHAQFEINKEIDEYWYNITLQYLSVEIFGTVYDNATNETIGYIGVGYYHIDWGLWNGTGTNETGFYRFMTVPGDISMNVWHDGYKQWTNWITVYENDSIRIDIYLDPLPNETAMIYGWITDGGSGDPLSWPNIHTYHHDEDYHNNTNGDGDGYYEIWVAPGNISFDVNNDGFQEFHDYFYVGDGWYFEYNVTMQREGEKNAVVYGWVNDTEGNPIEGVNVNIYNYNKDDGNGTATDANGYYMLGTFDGWSRIDTHHGNYFRYEDEFDVGPGDNLWNIVLEPMPPMNSTVYGWVTDDETGDPIEGAWVFVYDQEREQSVNWTGTNETGYYEFAVYAGDDHVGVAQAQGFFQAFAQLIVAENDTVMQNFTLEREPPANSTIYGWITDMDNGSPLENFRVRIEDRQHHNDTETWTDENGYYEFAVYQGRWNIDIDGGGEFFSIWDEFDVGEDEDYEYSAELEKRPQYDSLVRGYVRDNETGDPLEDVQVQFYDDAHDQWEDARTGSDGYYERWLYGADWEIEVDGKDYGDYQRYRDYVYVPESAEVWHNISLEGLPPQSAMIRGFVRDENGTALQAFLMVQGIYYDHENDTATDGTGYYEIYAYDGLNLIMAMVQQGYYANMSVIMVEANETIWYNISLVAQRDAEYTVSGHVLDENGDPIENARVVAVAPWNVAPLFADEGDGGDGGPPGTDGFHTTTDSNGYYELTLPAGTYHMSATAWKGDQDDDNAVAAIQEVVVEMTIYPVNFTLVFDILELPESYLIIEDFDDWGTATYRRETPAGEMMEAPGQIARLMIDFLFGNRDGYVNGSEAAMFSDFMLSMMERDGGDGPGSEEAPDNTTENLLTDGVYYNYNDTASSSMALRDVEGNITDESIPMMVMEYVFDAAEPILQDDNHTVELWVEHDSGRGSGGGGGDGMWELLMVPEGYKLASWDASDDVYVGEYGESEVVVAYIGTGGSGHGGGNGSDDGEWITLNFTTLNLAPVPWAWTDNWNSSAYECENFTFLAEYYDPDSENITFMWDFGDGSYAYTQNATHWYRNDGNYTVTFTAYDDQGAWADSFFDVFVMISPDLPAPRFVDPMNNSLLDGSEMLVTLIADEKPCNDTVMAEFAFSSDPDMQNYTYLGNDTDGTDGWTIIWDIDGVPDGIYYLGTRFVDDDGNEGFDVIMIVKDTRGPIVQLFEPSTYKVSGMVTISGWDYSEEPWVSAVAEYSDLSMAWHEIGTVEDPGENAFEFLWNTSEIDDSFYPGWTTMLRVTLTDAAGHTGSISEPIEVDNSLPDLRFDSPEDGDRIGGIMNIITVEIGQQSDDDAVQVDFLYRDDNSAALADGALHDGALDDNWTFIGTDQGGSDGWQIDWNITELTEGMYSLMAIMTDDVGLVQATEIAVYLDRTAPYAELDGIMNDDVLSGTVDFSLVNYDDDIARMMLEFLPDDEALALDWSLIGEDTDGTDGWSVMWDTTQEPDGIYGIRTTVTDDTGLVYVILLNVTLDNSVPVVSITAPVNGSFVDDMVLISAEQTNGNDAVSADFKYSLAGGAALADWTLIGMDDNATDGWSMSWDTTALADGIYSILVELTNGIGNTGTAQITVMRDTTPPAFAGITGITDATNGGATLQWTASAASDVDRYDIFVSETTFTSVTGMTPDASAASDATEYRITGLMNGSTYYFAAIAVDHAGNAVTDVTPMDALIVDTSVLAPNLEIQTVSLSPANPEEGKDVDVTVTIENTGTAAALDVNILVYVDDELKSTIAIGTLDISSSVTRTYTWKAPAGNHTITVELTYTDATGTISESVTVNVKEKSGDDDTPAFTTIVTFTAAAGAALLFGRRKRSLA